MSTYYAIQSKLSGDVIDIQGASAKAGVLLDAYPLKSTGNDNQLWEFTADLAGSGYYFIASKLSGDVIDIQGNSTEAGVHLDAYPRKPTGNDNQLWAFEADPAGSGYYFIRSRLSGHVIDIQKASKEAGALLDAFPQKASDYDNQLWRVVDGAFPAPVYTSISWAPEGTGPAPNSGTVGSSGNECAYQVGIAIAQDGTCTFSGYYQNRGDVWWGTAPPQGFAVAFFVYDTSGRAYPFAYSGVIPSAPQDGSLVTWNVTRKFPAIAENWYPIAAKNSALAYYWNTYDESVWEVLWKWLQDAAAEVAIVVKDLAPLFSGGDGSTDGSDGSDDAVKLPRPTLPPLPAGAPTGTAATLHKAGVPITGKGT